jgi:hypothetical protein
MAIGQSESAPCRGGEHCRTSRQWYPARIDENQLPNSLGERNMGTNPHVQDEVYRLVGEEVARNEFHPGPMAHAVAEAHGKRDLIEGLYIRFRYEELLHQMQADLREPAFACPNCGYGGRPVPKPRGSWALLILLFCLYIVPGVIYLFVYNGYKGVCAKCGRTLIERM